MTKAAVLGIGMLGLLTVLAVQGGEYSTGDYFELRRRVEATKAEAAALEGVVDSLRRAERAVLTDPAEQERIAREEYGMIRAGEYLYKVTTAPEP